MVDPSSQFKFAIVAGETSGDVLGAGLIKELSKLYPGAQFFGIGGSRMQESGCEILFHMDRIELMGLGELFDKLWDILKVRRSLFNHILAENPDLFIGVDVPDFNIGLEKKLRNKGFETVHYVSPTVWAWRGYRIHKIRRAVGHMLTLYPFEKRFYNEQGIPVTCVGHPIADEILEPNKLSARKNISQRFEIDFDLNEKVIAVLPGSRGSEVKALGVIFVEAVRMLHDKYPKLRFIIPFANERVKKLFLDSVGMLDNLPLTFLDENSRLAMEASDIVLLASGTAALEAALLERPHVVAYKLSPVTWQLFKRLRHVDHYSMSNQLLDDPVVPELMQDNATAQNIFEAIDHYLTSPDEIAQLQIAFRQIREQLSLDANVQASRAISNLLNQKLGDG